MAIQVVRCRLLFLIFIFFVYQGSTNCSAPALSPTPSFSPPPSPIFPPPTPTVATVPSPPFVPSSGGLEASKGLSGGQKAGVVIGVFVAAGAVGLGALTYKKRRRNIRRARLGFSARRAAL